VAADEYVFEMFVERTHAGLVKATIGTHGGGVFDVI